MERVDKILKAEISIKESAHPKSIVAFEHDIEFRHVSFKYEQKWVLRDINLTIPKGKMVALVGQSGSGKSTLVDLIPRYYDVQEGEILIDGINIKDLKIHDLRRLIGNVNQEAILFNDTFKNNIKFGTSEATDEQVAEAARIANAFDFIMQSEEGFNTSIGDRGGRLSGGQRQRVSTSGHCNRIAIIITIINGCHIHAFIIVKELSLTLKIADILARYFATKVSR